ncbi:hypothetical protein C8N35_10384 [Breoghania corrubedonensis]|uniref:Uncharacterized protein n=1 Tax=Breoghania corrubedonensis TaxID=665038 RepID=A0A2T5VAX6_9HYPH|nr:hypothetical protein C8N35_10384 [Breoghania corrubedonensis]
MFDFARILNKRLCFFFLIYRTATLWLTGLHPDETSWKCWREIPSM